MSDRDFEALRSIKSQMADDSVVVKLSDDELKVIVGGKGSESNSSGTGSGAGCSATVVHCHYIIEPEV